ncbi:hypothetical protein [Streptomyces mesophilus]|uniref:hypothetical protein n=1 Tax=Streptomyces mesophilus TaxID=1775132 RepID=UPI0033178F75
MAADSPYGASPHLNAPIPGGRPHMYRTTVARAVWVLVPVISLGFLAALPFVAVTIKHVIKPWVAVAYVVAEVVIIGVIVSIGDPGALAGFILILLIAVASTHTAFLDSDKVTVGK